MSHIWMRLIRKCVSHTFTRLESQFAHTTCKWNIRCHAYEFDVTHMNETKWIRCHTYEFDVTHVNSLSRNEFDVTHMNSMSHIWMRRNEFDVTHMNLMSHIWILCHAKNSTSHIWMRLIRLNHVCDIEYWMSHTCVTHIHPPRHMN